MANTFLINGQVLGVFDRIDLFGKVTKSTNRQLLQSRKGINRSSCVSNRNVCGFHVFEKQATTTNGGLFPDNTGALIAKAST